MSYINDYAYAMRREDYEMLFTSSGYEEGLKLFSLGYPYIITRDGDEYVVGSGKDINYKPESEAWQQFEQLCQSCDGGVVLLQSSDLYGGVEERIIGEDSSYFDKTLYGLISYKVSFELPKEGGLNA